MMFAAANTPDPMFLAGLLGCLMFLVGLVNGSMKLVDRLKGQPPSEHLAISADELKRRVTEVEAAVKVSDGRRKALYDRIDTLRVEVKEDIEGVRAGMHDRINSLEKQVGGLEVSADLTNQRLAQIDSKMDRFIVGQRHHHGSREDI